MLYTSNMAKYLYHRSQCLIVSSNVFALVCTFLPTSILLLLSRALRPIIFSIMHPNGHIFLQKNTNNPLKNITRTTIIPNAVPIPEKYVQNLLFFTYNCFGKTSDGLSIYPHTSLLAK